MALQTMLSMSTRFFSRSVLSTPISPFSLPIERWTYHLRNNLRTARLALLTGASTWSFPSLFPGIWDSVLRAVPKKKTSHMKKRHRQMAGKALKDVKNLSTCPGCGQIKRAHVLCPHCVKDIKEQWRRTVRE